MTLETDTTDATGDDPGASFDLWDYRRRVHESYRSAREGGSGQETWLAWCKARDELFASHSQSPVASEDRASFGGIPYFPYDPAWRFEVEAEPVEAVRVAIGHGGHGQTSFRRFGRVRLVADGTEVSPPCIGWKDTEAGCSSPSVIPLRSAKHTREAATCSTP